MPDLPPTAQIIEQAITRAQGNLLAIQQEDGHWEAELLVDSSLCSDTIAYLHWRGSPDLPLEAKCRQHILDCQLPDGGWNIFYGGPAEINATVKAYFALKLSGDLPHAPHIVAARSAILRLGGIPAMNTYGKLYLALLGQFPWHHLPSIPPEIFLMPRWFPLNISEMSSWTRAIIAPLAIINALKPTRQLPPEHQLHELYPAGIENTNLAMPRDPRFWAWKNFFLRCDRFFKFGEKILPAAIRRRALCAAETWMTERMGEGSEGLAAIFPSMLNSLIALQALGYSHDHPLRQKADSDFRGLFVVEDTPIRQGKPDTHPSFCRAQHLFVENVNAVSQSAVRSTFRIQPCLSPVWDTAITALALVESGLDAHHPALDRAATWLEAREVRFLGDWKVKNPGVEASGWAFEHNNKYYADTDDTMMVLMFLYRTRGRTAQFERALRWLLSFQCRNGGWAAFDKNVTTRWLEHIPFADHNAILDPPCSDLTGRVLELLGRIGHDPSDPAIARAITMIRKTQCPDGSWIGRWGVNYIYGTWQILRGLAAIGQNMSQPWILRARDWLESCQNPDGGWGETPDSYRDPSLKGRGTSTASQTAWALMGLCACGDSARPSLDRAAAWLTATQRPDGAWDEPETTGTGFPNVFYLKYEMYRQHFPLLALTVFREMLDAK